MACAAEFTLVQGASAAGAVPAQVFLAADGGSGDASASGEKRTENPSAAETQQESFFGLLDDDQKKVLDKLLEELEDGALSTQEQIDDAPSQAQEELDITLTQEQKEQISELMRRANELGLDREDILSGAQTLYEKYGSGIMESAEEAIRENVVEPVKEAVVEETKKTFRDFFHDMGETVKDFVLELIG